MLATFQTSIIGNAMTYPRAVIASWTLALLLACALAYDMAHAGELYLDAAGGVTFYQLTTADGDYLQKGLPHTLDLQSMAYRVGVGWRFNSRYSIQAGAFSLGSVKQDALFVADQDYAGGMCLANCSTAASNKMSDNYRGLELTVTRTFPYDDWAVFLKGGGAWIEHKFSIVRLDYGVAHHHDGEYPAVVMGVGTSYKWAYVEVDYYHGLGSANGFMGHGQSWPLSKEMLVTWFGVKVPLW